MLVDGNIPAGKPCPFAAKCTMKVPHCPTEDNLKQQPFSCALARLNQVIENGKQKGRRLPLLEKLRDSVGDNNELEGYGETSGRKNR